MDRATEVHNLDEAVSISYSTNTTGRSLNPIILSLAMGN